MAPQKSSPNFWLMKSEPDVYSIDDLAAQPKKTDYWEGIRNYQARNFMRDDMKKGDLAFFYHSNSQPSGIAGLMKIVRESYPDPTAEDPASKYFDAKCEKLGNRWVMVDVKFLAKSPEIISLPALRETPGLEDMLVLRKGSRLSIQPVTKKEFDIIIKNFFQGVKLPALP